MFDNLATLHQKPFMHAFFWTLILATGTITYKTLSLSFSLLFR